MPVIPGTDLTVSDLCLGGNVFGWTADEPTSFALLDRFTDATVSTLAPFVDTAESYGRGASEEILGNWMAERGQRDRMVVATKASRLDKEHPLSAAEIRTAVEGSLRRLRTDRIDLYYAHYDDGSTPLEETLRAFDELVQAGKVRHVAASNYSPEPWRECNPLGSDGSSTCCSSPRTRLLPPSDSPASLRMQ